MYIDTNNIKPSAGFKRGEVVGTAGEGVGTAGGGEGGGGGGGLAAATASRRPSKNQYFSIQDGRPKFTATAHAPCLLRIGEETAAGGNLRPEPAVWEA